MRHKLSHKDEVKGGKDSHHHHKKEHDMHMKMAKHHMSEMHKMAKHGHKKRSEICR